MYKKNYLNALYFEFDVVFVAKFWAAALSSKPVLLKQVFGVQEASLRGTE